MGDPGASFQHAAAPGSAKRFGPEPGASRSDRGANVFRSEAVPEDERLELPALASEIQQNGRPARLLADADAIVQTIAPELRSGDVVAILSNGGFGGIYEKLPARLKQLAETR